MYAADMQVSSFEVQPHKREMSLKLETFWFVSKGGIAGPFLFEKKALKVNFRVSLIF